MASADASVKVIERALNMLNCFTKEKLSLSLIEISREIDLPPSTTSRIQIMLVNPSSLSLNASPQVS